MSLLDSLRGELAGLDDAGKRQFLESIGVEVPPPAAPPKPPTALDHVREALLDVQQLGLSLSEVPSAHEIGPVLGVVVIELDELTKRVNALTSDARPATDPVDVVNITEEWVEP